MELSSLSLSPVCVSTTHTHIRRGRSHGSLLLAPRRTHACCVHKLDLVTGPRERARAKDSESREMCFYSRAAGRGNAETNNSKGPLLLDVLHSTQYTQYTHVCTLIACVCRFLAGRRGRKGRRCTTASKARVRQKNFLASGRRRRESNA